MPSYRVVDKDIIINDVMEANYGGDTSIDTLDTGDAQHITANTINQTCNEKANMMHKIKIYI